MNHDVVTLSEADKRLKDIGFISYALHAAVAVAAVFPMFEPSVGVLVIAFLIDIVKRHDADGTWQASHFRWRIQSVLWAFGLYVVTAPLFLLLYFPGRVAWWIISLWFMYRILRGVLNLHTNTPMTD